MHPEAAPFYVFSEYGFNTRKEAVRKRFRCASAGEAEDSTRNFS